MRIAAPIERARCDRRGLKDVGVDCDGEKNRPVKRMKPKKVVRYRMTVSVGNGGALGGGTRWCVACSNAYARAISRGSLKARPENVTPAGPGSALNPAGKGGLTTLSKKPPGTTTLG